MQLSKTSILFPRQSFHLYTKTHPSNPHRNSIYIIALLSANSSTPARWGLWIQPKASKRLFSKSSAAAVVFLAGDNTPRTSETLGVQDLVVKILIAENGVEGMGKRVRGLLKGCGEEGWVGSVVGILQEEGLVEAFDGLAFERLAAQTLESQKCHGSVAVEVDYMEEVGLKKHVRGEGEVVQEEKKKGGFGFWVSKPQGSQKALRKLYSWEREDDPYGGLM